MVMKDIENNPEMFADVFKRVEEILLDKKEHMTLEVMVNISLAAHAILEFVFNIKNFYYNIVNFKPLEAKKLEAQIQCETSKAQLKEAQDKLHTAESTVAELQKTLREKQNELIKVEEECAKLEWKSNLAGRLVSGLADEYKRWKGNVEELNDLMRKIVSVNLISAGFVS